VTHRSDTERFVTLLTSRQNNLLAYIITLLGDPAAAQDLLQETNLVLWRKADDFHATGEGDVDAAFNAWACKTAYYCVLTHRRKLGRDRLQFDHALLESVAEDAEHEAARTDQRQLALRHCLEQIDPNHRELVRQRYEHGESVTAIAAQLGRSPDAVSQLLYRIRAALLRCIKKALGERHA